MHRQWVAWYKDQRFAQCRALADRTLARAGGHEAWWLPVGGDGVLLAPMVVV
jgi:hypothetical protein